MPESLSCHAPRWPGQNVLWEKGVLCYSVDYLQTYIFEGLVKVSDEIWLPIPGYEGLYEVSSLGRVKSLARKGRHQEKMLKLDRSAKYPTVVLWKNNKKVTKRVHSIVLLAFEGPRPMGLVSRHFPDQHTSNNYIINLSYSTYKVNQADRIANETYHVGKKLSWTKLTEEQVCQIFHATGKKTEIAKRFNISLRQVWRIKRGENWGWLTTRELVLTGQWFDG